MPQQRNHIKYAPEEARAFEGERSPLGTADEVAAYVGVPKQTLYTWRTHSKGPRGIRVGKHLRPLVRR